NCLVFSPDGRHLACAGAVIDPQTARSAGEVTVWNLASRRGALTLKGAGGVVNSPADSPHGSRLAPVCENGSLVVWDATNGVQVWGSNRLRNQPASALAYSPDGKRLAVSYLLTDLRPIRWLVTHFDAASGQEARPELRKFAGSIEWLAFTPE